MTMGEQKDRQRGLMVVVSPSSARCCFAATFLPRE